MSRITGELELQTNRLGFIRSEEFLRAVAVPTTIKTLKRNDDLSRVEEAKRWIQEHLATLSNSTSQAVTSPAV
jgi:UDP-N-acetyl-D-mannosaminuronate dehydrogenase